MKSFRCCPILLASILILAFSTTTLAAQKGSLVLYSGRSETLVKPIINQFQKETGIKITVRYGNTAQIALAIQEEGDKSPADLFWAQDAGTLGAMTKLGVFATLPDPILRSVPEKFRSRDDTWVATSGRARVLAYAPDRVKKAELPKTIFDLTDPKWKGRIGWAPTNGSFQAFVTAMRLKHGEEKTKDWLTKVKANGALAYPKNTPIIQALAAGEIDIGLPNHYYLLRFKAADSKYPVAQTFFAEKDVANLVLVAGIGQLKTSRHRLEALEFIEYLLSPRAQQYFTSQVFEYPITDMVIPNERLVSLDELVSRVPDINLQDLGDLEGTLRLLTEVGLI